MYFATKGLEAALRRTLPECRPGSHRPCNALEVLCSEVLKLKEVAEKPSRALCDDDRIRFGQRLQPRREVWRLAYDGLLLRSA